MLLSASGGLQNPICIFYGFHVVLGAMLGDRRGALLAASMAGLGIAVLALAQRGGHLLSRPLGSPPLWLTAGTALLSVICLAYFAVSVLRYVERKRDAPVQRRALAERTRSPAGRAGAGLGRWARALANQRAAAALRPSPTATGRWLPPSGLTAAVPKQPGDSARFAHTEGGETRIIELLMLSGGGGRGPSCAPICTPIAPRPPSMNSAPSCWSGWPAWAAPYGTSRMSSTPAGQYSDAGRRSIAYPGRGRVAGYRRRQPRCRRIGGADRR